MSDRPWAGAGFFSVILAATRKSTTPKAAIFCREVVLKLQKPIIELHRFRLEDERTPVTEWLASLRDIRAPAQIEVRLRRVQYGEHGSALVILLCGGDKGSQPSALALAKAYGGLGMVAAQAGISR